MSDDTGMGHHMLGAPAHRGLSRLSHRPLSAASQPDAPLTYEENVRRIAVAKVQGVALAVPLEPRSSNQRAMPATKTRPSQ